MRQLRAEANPMIQKLIRSHRRPKEWKVPVTAYFPRASKENPPKARPQTEAFHQPIVHDTLTWQWLTDLESKHPLLLDEEIAVLGRRTCLDRARLIHRDLLHHTSLLKSPGSRLLDVGCSTGFFCHYFGKLGLWTTGIDDSRHRRHPPVLNQHVIGVARELTRRYGLSSVFHDVDEVKFLAESQERFDVVLLMGIPAAGQKETRAQVDGENTTSRFLEVIRKLGRATGNVLYVEYANHSTSLSVSELAQFLEQQAGFEGVEIIGLSSDFGNPIFRCRQKRAVVTAR
jgi:hypothetical protein